MTRGGSPLVRPLTDLLLATAALVERKAAPEARWMPGTVVRDGEVWLTKDWRGLAVWLSHDTLARMMEPRGLSAGQVALAIQREAGYHVSTIPDPLGEISALKRVIMDADGRAAAKQEPCPFCGVRPHVDTCVVVKIRAGKTLTGQG